MGRDVDARFDVNGVLNNVRHSYLPDRANIYQAGCILLSSVWVGKEALAARYVLWRATMMVV